jgi:hypothetical protein
MTVCLVLIEFWFMYLFWIEIVIQFIKNRDTVDNNSWFKIITCNTMKGDRLDAFKAKYFVSSTDEEV